MQKSFEQEKISPHFNSDNINVPRPFCPCCGGHCGIRAARRKCKRQSKPRYKDKFTFVPHKNMEFI